MILSPTKPDGADEHLSWPGVKRQLVNILTSGQTHHIKPSHILFLKKYRCQRLLILILRWLTQSRRNIQSTFLEYRGKHSDAVSLSQAHLVFCYSDTIRVSSVFVLSSPAVHSEIKLIFILGINCSRQFSRAVWLPIIQSTRYNNCHLRVSKLPGLNCHS